MGLTQHPLRSQVLALTLTSLAWLASTAAAQQFVDVTLSHGGIPGLSEQCYEALNTTVQSCPGFLAIHSVDLPRLEPGMLDFLCTSDCMTSLASVRGTIVAGCTSDTDVVDVGRVTYPATYMIDRMIYAYEVSCAADSDSGMYCDEIYLDNLANGTMADACSDCALRVGSIMLNSPFDYDQEFAAEFVSRTSSCGAAGYDFTSPTAYAVTTNPYASPTGSPTCASPYLVQPGDTCNSIALAKGISSYSVAKAGQAGPGCAHLPPGKSLCLPEPCTLYKVKVDDRCEDIIAAVPGMRAHDILLWNPNINPLCSNIDDLYEQYICISPPGRSLEDVTAITSVPPVTSQPPATAIPRPPNAKEESTDDCAAWYEVQAGDDCQLVSIANGIEIRDFFFLNPSIDDPGCTNLWLETSYCVKAVGDITTYPSYPYSTSAPYTLSSPTYITTTRKTHQTVVPRATPIVVLPLAPGSHDEADGCLSFAQHRPVPVQKDQSQQVDVPRLTNTVNTCDYICSTNDIYLEDLLTFNPSLEAQDPCQFQPGFRYCVGHTNATDTRPYGGCAKIDLTPVTGTIETCSCFTILRGFDAGLHLCEDVIYNKDFTVSDLMRWNPWIGSTEADCDQGLYAGMADADERALCTKAGGGSSATSIATTSAPTGTATATSTGTSSNTTSSPVVPPGPTQAGIVAGCQAYHVAVTGDGCWDIADSNGITLDELYAWNPALNGDCSGLWLDYAYCIEGPSSTGSTPPGPTQPGTIETCETWHLVSSGQGCWDIQQLYGIPDYETLLAWNPSLGAGCESLWLDYAICVGA